MSATIDNETFQPTATQVILTVRLEAAYGLPAQRIAGLDRKALIRTAATLDFLSNNLPATVEPTWVEAVVPSTNASTEPARESKPLRHG